MPCDIKSINPLIVTSPSITNIIKFIITAQTPYFIKVTNARASIMDDDLFNNNNAMDIVKNNEAVGLSGTKGTK